MKYYSRCFYLPPSLFLQKKKNELLLIQPFDLIVESWIEVYEYYNNVLELLDIIFFFY